jgi:hypothetical protein
VIRRVRAALMLTGALVAGWGGWLLWPQLTGGGLPNAVSVAGWLLGGPLLHDALLAPAVGLLGIAVAIAVPPRWRTPVAAGLVISGVLVLVALPGVLRPSPGPPNPGLADRNYPLGLLATLTMVWLLVLIAGWLGGRQRRGRPTLPVMKPGTPTR